MPCAMHTVSGRRILRPDNFTQATPLTSLHRCKREVRLRGAGQICVCTTGRPQCRSIARRRRERVLAVAALWHEYPGGIPCSRHNRLLRAPSWRLYWGRLSCLNVLRSELSPSISRRVKWARSLRSRTAGCQRADYQSGARSDFMISEPTAGPYLRVRATVLPALRPFQTPAEVVITCAGRACRATV
jgi:hypothetical protein